MTHFTFNFLETANIKSLMLYHFKQENEIKVNVKW